MPTALSTWRSRGEELEAPADSQRQPDLKGNKPLDDPRPQTLSLPIETSWSRDEGSPLSCSNSQPVESLSIKKNSCFTPLSFGVIFGTAIVTGTFQFPTIPQTSGWKSLFHLLLSKLSREVSVNGGSLSFFPASLYHYA